jgi:hypothetical protein
LKVLALDAQRYFISTLKNRWVCLWLHYFDAFIYSFLLLNKEAMPAGFQREKEQNTSQNFDTKVFSMNNKKHDLEEFKLSEKNKSIKTIKLVCSLSFSKFFINEFYFI